MADTICYVYGIADPSLDLAGAPAGLEGRPVTLEPEGGIAAVVTRLDAAAYAPEAVEARSANVEWLGPRAVAHDRVLSWASDRGRGAVVPMPMFSMFRDADGVRAMLRDRVDALRRALDRVARGREYALRVFRIEARLAEAIGALSPRIAELEAAAAAAPPGQQYLLKRKLDAERKTEARAVSAAVAREVLETLRERSLGAVSSPLPTGVAADAPGVAVLNAAFLVAHDEFARFQEALTALAERYAPTGFHFDFTGPWPAYHFAGDAADGR